MFKSDTISAVPAPTSHVPNTTQSLTAGMESKHIPGVHHVELHNIPSPRFQDLRELQMCAVGRELAISLQYHKEVQVLKRLLTVPRRDPTNSTRKLLPLLFYREESPWLKVPSMAWFPGQFRPKHDVRVLGSELPTNTVYTNPCGLFAFQDKVVTALHAHLMRYCGGMVVSPCGMGKSEMIAATIARCGVRAVVFVPFCVIARQLVLLLRARLPMLTVEQLDGSNKRATVNTHVIVAVTNSATSEAHRELFAACGLVVVDEAHHVPAKSMLRALANTRSRLRVGFTATPTRTDGCHKVFPALLGPVVATVHRPWMPVVVRAYSWGGTLSPRVDSFVKAISALCEDPSWTALIAPAVSALARRAKATGGRVLVMVERVRLAMMLCARAGGAVTDRQWARLERLENKTAMKPVFRASEAQDRSLYDGLTSALYVGGPQTQRERETPSHGPTARVADIVWTTRSMASEGLDLPHIKKEVLLCEVKNPQQHVGRCLRMTTMARVPEVFMILTPNVKLLAATQRAKLRYFRVHEGWPVATIHASAFPQCLRREGVVPTEPTRTWKGHKRGKKRVHEVLGVVPRCDAKRARTP